MNNNNAYLPAGGIDPAVLAAFPPNKPRPAPSPAVSPAQLINPSPAQLMAARQQKMDEQRRAARMQILQQNMNLYPQDAGAMLPPAGLPRRPSPRIPRSTPTPASPGPKRKHLPDDGPPVKAESVPPEAVPRAASTPVADDAAARPSASVTPTPALPAATTRISHVPLLTSAASIPALSPREIHDVQAWMAVDRQYEGVFRDMKDRMAKELAARPRGWWERAFVVPGAPQAHPRRTRDVFEVRYPRRKDRERRRGRREGLRLPRKLDIRDVNKPELLVPIRLEFDVEHHKMRDTFVWNLNDPVVTPEAFAQSVVEDYALSPSYHAVIAKAIQDQLSDFRAHSAGIFDSDGEGAVPVVVPVLNEKEADPVCGRLGRQDQSPDEQRWWAQWKARVRRAARGKVGRSRKRRRLREDDDGVDADVEDVDDADGWGKGKTLDEMEVDEAKMQEEMRILIRLDVIVGSMKLDDQFEWDLENEAITPEEFAEVYVQDLGLNGEFKTAIAHSIREQIQIYQKSLFLIGHPSDGSPVQDDDLRTAFLPPLTSAARTPDQITSYTPTLAYLSDGELDEREKDMNRRRKRNTRARRGIALPDREPIRTCRTPAIGFPELDPATLALAAAANAPVSRRAAAAAASVTIANMVASENGTTAFLPQVAAAAATIGVGLQQQQQQPGGGGGVHKEKKGTGGRRQYFKAPCLPPEVLSARARVGGPTPTTAADVSMLPAPLENDPPPPVAVMSTVGIVGGGGATGTGTGTQTPDGRAGRGVTAKRAKELEREAKEREFADGQHPNLIDGVWHCSNCGCPDSIAVGRRKGPLGDKSQCGICGKYWHRHRRPRPVEYNPDPEHHLALKTDVEQTKAVASAKKKGGAAARTRAETSEPQTPLLDTAGGGAGAGAGADDERGVSPVSTASSASEPPLAQRVKANNNNNNGARTPAPPGTPVPAPAGPMTTSSSSSPVKTANANAEPPQWLVGAKAAMMARYPNDRFETILRKVNAGSQPEWRIKCLDCPGKLYTPGPGETLANYEVHLKNRQHRQRVNERLSNGAEV